MKLCIGAGVVILLVILLVSYNLGTNGKFLDRYFVFSCFVYNVLILSQMRAKRKKTRF